MVQAIKNSPYLTGAWKQGNKEGRLQGALGEVALMKLCIQNEGSWKEIQEHIEKYFVNGLKLWVASMLAGLAVLGLSSILYAVVGLFSMLVLPLYFVFLGWIVANVIKVK